MDKAMRMAGEIRPPRVGTIAAIAVSGSASSLNFATAGAPATSSSGFESNLPAAGTQSQAVSTSGGGTVQTISPLNPEGYVGKWVDIFADGADLGIITGPTQASVTGGNAPALATTGNAGTAGCCMRIASGTYRAYFVTPDDLWLGFVGSGTGTMRIALSSRAG